MALGLHTMSREGQTRANDGMVVVGMIGVNEKQYRDDTEGDIERHSHDSI